MSKTRQRDLSAWQGIYYNYGWTDASKGRVQKSYPPSLDAIDKSKFYMRGYRAYGVALRNRLAILQR